MMKARPVVALSLTVIIGVAIIGPIVVRMLDPNGTQTLPESVVAGLVDLLKVITGGLIAWLSRTDDAG